MSAKSNTIRDAEEAIRRRFSADGFRGTLKYNLAEMIEAERWWYIPYKWIGCFGFIVNKDDLYVNWLGSGLFKLELCFWGHDHGIVNDLVDFSFAPDTDTTVAAKLLSGFMHMHPNARGVLPTEPVWYRDSEIPSALSTQFPLFKRHLVWTNLRGLFEAYEKDGLRFDCRLAKKV
ncbi:MAG: hypothetical protein JWM68_2406 [Verrucomicrobiales bacterium]|nr:hypothetical protein [Verrucomicrobiales bacterium]